MDRLAERVEISMFEAEADTVVGRLHDDKASRDKEGLR